MYDITTQTTFVDIDRWLSAIKDVSAIYCCVVVVVVVFAHV